MAGWWIVCVALQLHFAARVSCINHRRSIPIDELLADLDFDLHQLHTVASHEIPASGLVDASTLFERENSHRSSSVFSKGSSSVFSSSRSSSSSSSSSSGSSVFSKGVSSSPHSRDVSTLNHIEWRQNLSRECLESELWNPEFDQARQLYIYRLGRCIRQLPQQDMSLDDAHLNTTVCDTCISDFVTSCDENGAQLCSVDVRFTDEYKNTQVATTSSSATPLPTNLYHQFKYRFYECIPDECGKDDSDDFARGWFSDIANDLEVEEDDLEFTTHCPRSDADVPLGVHDDDGSNSCNINLITSACYRDLVTMRNDRQVRVPRARYFNRIRQSCDCIDIPYEIGNVTEKESACLCGTRARELEEACIAPGKERKFCYYSFSYITPDASNPGGIHRYNFTYFDCSPGECDNPFDRYSLDALRYKALARESAFGARFESYCFAEEKATSFLHTEACEDDEDRLRSGADNSTSLSSSAEDVYNNASIQCFHDLLRQTPREAEVYGRCDEMLEPYRASCELVNGTMCITTIKFSEVVDASFGEQQFHMTTYQCVAPECDNDFDRSVYENYDRWMTDASLGVEENKVFVDWTCGPTPTPTGVPTPTPTTSLVPTTSAGGDIVTAPPAQPGNNIHDPDDDGGDHSTTAKFKSSNWIVWLAVGLVTLVLFTTAVFAYRHWSKRRRGRQSTESRWAGVFQLMDSDQRLDQRLDSRIEHSRSSSRVSHEMTQML